VSLWDFDLDIIKDRNCARLIGIDEAGRGPLAGPVSAAAAWIPAEAAGRLLPFVNDSKKLSGKRREQAFSLMVSAGVRFGWWYSPASEIDRINILEATFNAMGTALRKLTASLGIKPEEAFVLVDGNRRVKRIDGFRQLPVTDGDALSLSVAAASVFAKVIRDRWMRVLDAKYPGYGFAQHKGYGSKLHLEAIERLGPCPEHRMSFAPLKNRQETLFSK